MRPIRKMCAGRAVQAEWCRIQRGYASLSITLARSRKDLFPELPAIVEGFKPEIDATTWLVTRVTNTIDDSGFTTALELELKIPTARDE